MLPTTYIAEVTGYSLCTLRDKLHLLYKQGLVERGGNGRGRTWSDNALELIQPKGLPPTNICSKCFVVIWDTPEDAPAEYQEKWEARPLDFDTHHRRHPGELCPYCYSRGGQ